MKLNNRRLVENSKALGEVSKKQLPVKVSYAIAKNIAKIESLLKIYNKEKDKLIEKYGEKDEKNEFVIENGGIKLKEGTKKDWNNDLETLLDIENEVEIHKFKFDEIANVQISPAELQAIDYMIEE